MPTPILVVGHKNPDNDSISAAVSYAYLQNELAKRRGTDADEVYVPACLGPLPPESAWVLEENGIEAPLEISHVYTRTCDAMTENPLSISADATIFDAVKILKQHDIRSLVVEGQNGQYEGLISTRAIAERYLASTLNENGEGVTCAQDAVESLSASLNEKVSTLVNKKVMVLSGEDMLKEVAEDLVASDLREGVVLDDAGHAIGIITRSDVAKAPKRKVILVDHNEVRQAAAGIEQAEVVQIVDHHRIADVSTASPIQFINLPVGSTATIITMMYRMNNIEIPKGIAAVLLSAILTDTVILKSPTATSTDREQVDFLSQIIDRDYTEFGLKIFRCRGGEEGIPIEKFVEADSKEFATAEGTVLIAQHETVDLEGALAREEEARAHMRKLLEKGNYQYVLLMVTDIIAEGSQFLVEGNTKLVDKAFDITCNQNGGNWMPGVLSRKKQVAAKVLA
jgi:manganese-dependent inorganic pyrophosphatase